MVFSLRYFITYARVCMYIMTCGCERIEKVSGSEEYVRENFLFFSAAVRELLFFFFTRTLTARERRRRGYRFLRARVSE